MKARSATIRNVAEAAELSPATVSRYLSGQLVLPATTVERIEHAVTALGYRPNAAARRLKRGRSETLGLAVTDIAYPFFAEIASAAEAEADVSGYNLAIFNTRNRIDKELEVLGKIADRQVDGLILLTNHIDDGRLSKAISEAGPVVIMDEDVANVTTPKIFAENVSGGRIATQHVIDCGHRCIAFVGGGGALLSSRERYEGFSDAMVAAGLPIDESMVLFGDYEEEFGRVALRRLLNLDQCPTAIVVGADLLALGIIREAQACRIDIPKQISIVGFDDLPMASLLAPPLTTIHQSPEEFGRKGVQALVALIENRGPADVVERVPVRLVMRSSVGKPVQRRAAPRGQRLQASMDAQSGMGVVDRE